MVLLVIIFSQTTPYIIQLIIHTYYIELIKVAYLKDLLFIVWRYPIIITALQNIPILKQYKIVYRATLFSFLTRTRSMTSKVTGEGAEGAVQKNHCNFHL